MLYLGIRMVIKMAGVDDAFFIAISFCHHIIIIIDKNIVVIISSETKIFIRMFLLIVCFGCLSMAMYAILATMLKTVRKKFVNDRDWALEGIDLCGSL